MLLLFSISEDIKDCLSYSLRKAKMSISHLTKCQLVMQWEVIFSNFRTPPPLPPKKCWNSGSTLDESASTLCSLSGVGSGQKGHKLCWQKCPKAFDQDCYISCQESITEYAQCPYLLKPLGFFHLLNKAQVCLCTRTGGTLKLLETCSHCSDIWKLRRNKMVQQI